MTLAALPEGPSLMTSTRMVAGRQISVFHGSRDASDAETDMQASKILIHILKREREGREGERKGWKGGEEGENFYKLLNGEKNSRYSGISLSYPRSENQKQCQSKHTNTLLREWSQGGREGKVDRYLHISELLEAQLTPCVSFFKKLFLRF